MDTRVLLFLFIVCTCWCSNARELLTANHFTRKDESFSVLQTNNKLSEGEAQLVEEVSKNNELCTLCEAFASEALIYLSENKTQTEIISVLHKSCSKILKFKQECIVLVDYYAPLFFLEVSSIQPEYLCQNVGRCKQAVSISQQLSENACDLCHRAVTEAILKLKDPDTQLEIIELLLKACNSVEGYAKKCKKLVFEYGPIILVNAEQFLENNDICTTLHACASPAVGAEQEALPRTEISMHSASQGGVISNNLVKLCSKNVKLLHATMFKSMKIEYLLRCKIYVFGTSILFHHRFVFSSVVLPEMYG